MAKSRFSRAQRAQLRKPFPSPSPVIAGLTIAELAEWENECGRQSIVTSAWTLSGFRWRRARRKANLEYTHRLLSHVGPAPGLCDKCQTRTATVHTASGSREAPLFEHHCDECESDTPVAFMSIAMASARRDSRS